MVAADDAPFDVDVDPLAPAGIAYTSGTTGYPKGAVHSQHNLLMPGAVLVATRGYGRDLRKGDFLAAHHPQHAGAHHADDRRRPAGARSIMDRIDAGRRRRVDPRRAGHGLERAAGADPLAASMDDASRRATSRRSRGVDRRRRLPRADPRRVRAEVRHAGADHLRVERGADGRHHRRSRRRARRSARAVGRCRTSTSQIVDDEVCVAPDDRRPRAAGVYHPMLGYWERPEATAETLAGGMLHTGDLGFVDDDGFLHIRDRKSLVIIRGGANVYPAEIERVLHELDGVAACAVVGVPDERLGERVVAAVELADGAAVTAEDALREHCLANLAKYKVPERWVFVDAFPRNSMNKIQRREGSAPFRPVIDTVGCSWRVAVSSPRPKRTRSSRMNWMPQRSPKPERCATSSAAVCTGPASGICAAQESVSPTAMVDSTRPANDSIQNGATSRQRSLSSRRPHVQRRFRLYDGTVATAVAITFAIQASIPATSRVMIASVDKLITVVMTDTLMQRVSRCQRLRSTRSSPSPAAPPLPA